MRAPHVEARPKGGARAEKEIDEKAKIIRHQIVSTYFLNGAFKVLSEVVFYSFFFVSEPDIFGLPNIALKLAKSLPAHNIRKHPMFKQEQKEVCELKKKVNKYKK